MKIKWIGNRRLIPFIGILENGDVRDITEQAAKDLIRQGLAIAYYKPKKRKTRKIKE